VGNSYRRWAAPYSIQYRALEAHRIQSELGAGRERSREHKEPPRQCIMWGSFLVQSWSTAQSEA